MMMILYLLLWWVLIALIVYLCVELCRGIVEIVSDIRDFIGSRHQARESEAREVARIESEANESVIRLQWAYWQAAQRLHEERDHDGE